MEELVEKAKNKVDGAFDELILSMEKEMYLIAKSRLKNDDDIADVMQETILMCFKNINKLKNNNLFKTWSIRILINECNKTYKKRKREIISLDESEIEIKAENDYSEITFNMLIKDLKQEEKTILTMYYCFQYTTREISDILKINENTIKTRIIRAKNKLKNKFGGDGIWKI